jgi:mannose-6-phosphate isomerase class I
MKVFATINEYAIMTLDKKRRGIMNDNKYRPNPLIEIQSVTSGITEGFDEIGKVIKNECRHHRFIAIETYPGTDKKSLVEGLGHLFDAVYDTDEVMYANEKLNDVLFDDLTDDRVFGRLTHKKIEHITDSLKFSFLVEKLSTLTGKILLIGFGSSRLVDKACVIFTSVTRWEIQMRFRNKTMDNYNAGNFGEDPLRMFKRGYFVDWRIADNYKDSIWNQVNYVMDTDVVDQPKMLSKDSFMKALKEVVSKPFSMVPYFDPGVWGGQWMKEKCNLDPEKANYAWSFNGVPEENALTIRIGDRYMTFQAMDAVMRYPEELMGKLNVARFGREFPIRFDFLDTMEGGHLSLQVHPLTDYIQRQFGMHYTQDESYYILDAKEDAHVYLGVKNGVKLDDLMNDLQLANAGEKFFDDELYINKIPAKKHDHFLIPAGTIHCSGRNSMVLEISATPYIFTFKMWDWGRLGMDGMPRPVHLAHASRVVDIQRDTDWVYENLVNDVTLLNEEEGLKQERTGLHELEFIDTVRTWFSKPFELEIGHTVHSLMLVEGDMATIKSKRNAFAPFNIYYAECVIIPASIDEITIIPQNSSKHALIHAFVRATKKNKKK